MSYKIGDLKKYSILFLWVASVMNGGKVCYITHAKFLYGQKKINLKLRLCFVYLI